MYPRSTYVSSIKRPGDVMHTKASISKIKMFFGYKTIVHFWEGLDATAKWYDQNWEKIK
jgi:nucleoside-diphosphate-sugar epimerase